MTRRTLAAAVLGALALALSACGANDDPARDTAGTDPEPTFLRDTPTTAPTTPAPVETEEPAPDGSIPGDGTFEVGVDMEPGVYRSESNDATCVSQISSDINGAVPLGGRSGAGTLMVEVKKGQYFITMRCNDWVPR